MLDFLLQKGFDEDTRPGKIPREDAALVKGTRTPAVSVRTYRRIRKIFLLRIFDPVFAIRAPPVGIVHARDL